MADINRMAARSGKVIRSDNTIANEADGINADGSRKVQLTGSKVEEQLTQADAVGGVLTFAENIQFIGIYNRDTVNDGVFTVNGIALTIPKGESAEFNVGGTASPAISVTGSTSYIVTRYV